MSDEEDFGMDSESPQSQDDPVYGFLRGPSCDCSERGRKDSAPQLPSILWFQQHLSTGQMEVAPVPGPKNPADLGAKRLSHKRLVSLMRMIGFYDMDNDHLLTDDTILREEARQLNQSAVRALNALSLLSGMALQGCQDGGQREDGNGSSDKLHVGNMEGYTLPDWRCNAWHHRDDPLQEVHSSWTTCRRSFS